MIEEEPRGRGVRFAPPAMILAALVSLAVGTASAKETVLVEFGSPMKYLDNRTDPGLGTSWTTEGFDDAAWPAGAYGVGYEVNLPGAQSLLRTAVPSGTLSVYTRARFEVADPATVRNVFLGADWDDGWIAWINGVEVYRSPQMPAGAPAWNTNAASHESSNGGVPSYGAGIDVSSTALAALHVGVNVLAVGVWNSGGAASSDLVIVPRLSINRPAARIVRGPYLQRGAPDSIVVRWRTDVATDAAVRWGSAPDALGSAVTAVTARTEHELVVTGLEPDIRYFYSVGSIAESIAGGDQDHAFTTPPVPGTARRTRVWVLGDSGTADANARAVRDAYETFTGPTTTDFWLMLGDNAYASGTDAEYQAAVFDMYPGLLRRSVLWPAYGNHDAMSADAASGTGVYFDVFTLPTGGESGGAASNREAYYAFDHGNIHVVALDSSESSRAANGPMATWLLDDLAATPADWIVAIWHHPPYTKGSHDSDVEIELREMRQNILPILEQGGVDLVLGGHSHSYERSYLLDGHYGLSSTFTEAHKKDAGDGRPAGEGAYEKATLAPSAHAGAVYAVAGSSGQTSGGALNHPAMFVSMNRLGSLVLDIVGNRLDATFLAEDGSIQDTFSMIKERALLPVVDFTAEPRSGVAPLGVKFRDLTVHGPVAWTWDLDGDGATDSIARDPEHAYAAPGIYTVRLEATNVAGSGAEVRSGYVCVTSPAPPGPLSGLGFEADRETMSWNAVAAGVHDVEKGDLPALRASGGNFGGSSLGCLAARTPSAQASDPAAPLPGGGFYYLVRAVDCSGRLGTYDDGVASQSGTRDGSATACP